MNIVFSGVEINDAFRDLLYKKCPPKSKISKSLTKNVTHFVYKHDEKAPSKIKKADGLKITTVPFDEFCDAHGLKYDSECDDDNDSNHKIKKKVATKADRRKLEKIQQEQIITSSDDEEANPPKKFEDLPQSQQEHIKDRGREELRKFIYLAETSIMIFEMNIKRCQVEIEQYKDALERFDD